MLTCQKNYIISYISDGFIEALEKFEDIVQIATHEVMKSPYAKVYLGNNSSLTPKPISALSPGFNKGLSTEVTIIHILWNQMHTFLLVVESLPAYDSSHFYCVIVETSNFQAPFFDTWKKQLSLSINLILKEPYLQTQIMSDMQIIRVVTENIEWKEGEKWKAKVDQIKSIGNESFKVKDYLTALIYYEYALALCHDYSDCKTRAILYTNTAACLYYMNLYEASLKYSSIAIKINNSYPKAYARKIHSLMQKKVFGQIPSLLLILQEKISSEELLKINKKYSVYLSNSLGMYNWKEIAQINKNSQISVSEYFSKSIGLRLEGDKYVYYALDQINKYDLLIISKPVVFQLSTSDTKHLDSLFERVYKCMSIQKSFYNSIKNLPCPCHPNGGSNSPNDRFMEGKEVEKKLDRSLIFPKDLLNNEKSSFMSIGVWSQLFKFSQNCEPNCSFIHFQSIMCLSASKKIRKGETLTIDIASDTEVLKRREVLLNKYGVQCKCKICEWKDWPKDLSNNKEVYDVVHSLKNLRMMKQLLWGLIRKKKIFQVKFGKQYLFEDVLDKYVETIRIQVHWEDLLNLLRLLRDEEKDKNSKLIRKALADGFCEFLKIPPTLANEIIDVIL